MNEEDFRIKVMTSLGEIKTTLDSSHKIHLDHETRLRELKTIIDKAKGGWFVLVGASSIISGITAFATTWVLKLK